MDKFIYMVEFDVLMVGAYDGNEWIVEGFDNPMVDRWLEPYSLPTEEEINAILSIKAKLYGEKDSEHGEEYPVRAVPHYMWHSVSKAIINLLKGER
jgi:hypothetical protein